MPWPSSHSLPIPDSWVPSDITSSGKKPNNFEQILLAERHDRGKVFRTISADSAYKSVRYRGLAKRRREYGQCGNILETREAGRCHTQTYWQ